MLSNQFLRYSEVFLLCKGNNFSEHPQAKLLGFPPEAEKFCRGHKRVLPLEQNERL